MFSRTLLVALTMVAISSPALAHMDPAQHGSFAAGFTHPLFGLDHVLAMIAVGLWAALAGGRAIWGLPTAFVGAMVLGFVLALAGLPLPMVEPMILTSVVVLGALVALAARLSLFLSAALVGVFGLFHGYAHGGEIGSAVELGYAAGFIIATALLHAAGVLIGYGASSEIAVNRSTGRKVTQLIGAITAAGGVYLAVAG